MAVTTANFDTVAPSPLASISTYVALGAIDAGPWRSLSYTAKVATNDVKWTVYGANISDYTDEVAVQSEATITAGAVGTYAVTQAPYRYYRAKIKDAVGGTHGTVTLNGIVKP